MILVLLHGAAKYSLHEFLVSSTCVQDDELKTIVFYFSNSSSLSTKKVQEMLLPKTKQKIARKPRKHQRTKMENHSSSETIFILQVKMLHTNVPFYVIVGCCIFSRVE